MRSTNRGLPASTTVVKHSRASNLFSRGSNLVQMRRDGVINYGSSGYICKQRKAELHRLVLLDDLNQRALNVAVNTANLSMEEKALLSEIDARVQSAIDVQDLQLHKRRLRLKQLLVMEEEQNRKDVYKKMQQSHMRVKEKKQVDFKIREEQLDNERKEKCLVAFEKHQNDLKKLRGIDDRELQQILKCQMKEKENIQRLEMEDEDMWHELMMRDCASKDMEIRKQYNNQVKLKTDTRKFYNNQIMETNYKRNEERRKDMELENERIKKLLSHIEKQNIEAQRLKLQKTQELATYYIQERNLKERKLLNETYNDKQATMQMKMEDQDAMRKHKELVMSKMQQSLVERSIYLENYSRERSKENEIDREAERLLSESVAKQRKKMEEEDVQQEMLKNKLRADAKNDLRKDMASRAEFLESERAKLRIEEKSNRQRQELDYLHALSKNNAELKRKQEYANYLTEQMRNNEIKVKEREEVEKQMECLADRQKKYHSQLKAKLPYINVPPGDNTLHPFNSVLKKLSISQEKEEPLQIQVLPCIRRK